MTWLIAARAVAGIGAGGILSMVMIIIADLVSLRDRGKYQGIIGSVFGFSSVVGPLLGGVFTDHATWRWAFFINLPFGVITVAVVVKFLRLPHTKGSFKEKIKQIDYWGAISLVIGLILVLLPLNWGGVTYPWNSPIVIALFCAGGAVLFIFCMIEWKVASHPIIPFHLFKYRNNIAAFSTALFIGMGFFGTLFFMPLYFQIAKQESATSAGLEMIPMMIGLLIASIGSGQLITRFGRYRPFVWCGLVIATVGTGLLSLLDVDSPRGKVIGFLFVFGFGLGCSSQTTLLSIQNAAQPKDIAVATTCFTFFRTIGSVLGVAIVGTVFNNSLRTNLKGLIEAHPEISSVTTDSYLAPTFGPVLERQILHAYMMALRNGFHVCIPFMAVAWICSLFIEHHTLRRTRGSAPTPAAPGASTTPAAAAAGSTEEDP
jgi:MFS family permease